MNKYRVTCLTDDGRRTAAYESTIRADAERYARTIDSSREPLVIDPPRPLDVIEVHHVRGILERTAERCTINAAADELYPRQCERMAVDLEKQAELLRFWAAQPAPGFIHMDPKVTS